MACEIITLIGAIIYCAFGRNKHFSFLTAVSALIGAYISATTIYKVNSKLNARKYIDIISAIKNSNNNEEIEKL